jgi:hypothetical protein
MVCKQVEVFNTIFPKGKPIRAKVWHRNCESLIHQK